MCNLRSMVMLTAIVGLLAGCGPALQWTRPDTSQAQLQVDSAECGSLARDQAFRESFYAMPYGPGYGFGPWYPWSPYARPFGRYHYHDSFMWRGQRESELQNFCLRARGYRLEPVEEVSQR